MSEKLTLADCFKYPNALVQFIADEIKTGFVNSIFTKDDYQLDIECCPRAFYRKPLSECQLILRSIDDLTDKEKERIAKISLEVSEVFFRFDRYEMCCMEDYLITIKDKKCIDYLRSINIDIDGFIENGKAVKNDTL